MRASLVRGRYVVIPTDRRDGAEVLEDAALFQQDGVIREIGSYAALRERHPLDPVVGSADHVVRPGLVNAHHHVGLTPFQLGSPDQSRSVRAQGTP
jgi:cytosine/adenosine deaminase-related metal-dependent hydrolase